MSAALEVGTPEWTERRRSSLGASEVAAALGLMPDGEVYSRPIDIWLDKTGAERVTPIARGRTEAGHRFEPVVRNWYRDLVRSDVVESNTLRHPEHAWVTCTPDSLVMVDGAPKRNVQIKCVGARPSFSWPGMCSIPDDDGPFIINPSEGIPQYYRVQVEWEMGILHAIHHVEETHLVALLGGTELRIYEVRRDQELWGALFEAASKFWFDHVVADVPPPPDGSEAFKKFLARRYPQAERADLEPMPREVEALARRYLKSREIEGRASDAKDLVANELRAAIGERAGFVGLGIKVVWRNTKKGRSLDVRETG